MDFRQLRYFLAVAELESFTAAATRLNVAQSALSRQVANLETELGTALFHRFGKRIRLAPAGAKLKPAVAKLLADAEAIRALALSEQEAVAGTVALGAHHSDGAVLFPRLFEAMGREFPAVKLDLVQGLTAELQELLLRGRLDAAVLTRPDPLPGFDLALLMREALYFLAPSEFCPEGLGADCAAREVLGLPLIVPHQPHRERLAYEEIARRHKTMLTIGAEVDGLPLMKSMARQGRGFLILPRTAIQEFDDPAWRVIRLRGVTISRYLASRSTAASNRALQETMKQLQAQVKLLRDEGIAL